VSSASPASTVQFSGDAKARFMAEALAESRKALPVCRPNPPVGCVIVEVGEGGDGHGVGHDVGYIVARGFTGRPGEPHAEAAALAALGPDRDGSGLAAFVTLEPCAFAGRTPSCAKALVDRGIGLVVVAILDPHTRNSGRGVQLLRDAGVAVELGVLEPAVRTFLEPYLLGL
jgi:pyrimidine deaminase RibD-like protein